MSTERAPAPASDGRVERWREHREQRRRGLVDATLVALEQHGPDVSLSRIAAVAGIPKPKIYRHFDDKADLIRAVGDRLRAQVVSALAEIDPELGPRTRAHASLDAYLRLVEQHPQAFRMLMSSPPSTDGANSLAGASRVVAAMLPAPLRGDHGALPHVLVGAILGATDWWVQQPAPGRSTREELVAQLAEILLAAGSRATGRAG